MKSLFNEGFRSRAFSLTEVIIAIGIASFSLLVIFSIIPIGLGVLQDTGRQMVGTEIFNKMESELVATPFYSDPLKTVDTLDNYRKSRYPVYFDMEGNELAAGTPPAVAVFTATCALSEPSSGSGEMRLAKVDITVNAHPAFSRTFLLVNKGN